jgi:TonB family protein
VPFRLTVQSLRRELTAAALSALLTCALFSSLALGKDDLSQYLDGNYEGRTFVLRGFYSWNELHYDSSGRLKEQSPSGDWTVSGLVRVKKAHVSGDRLKIEARRMVYGWDTGGFQELRGFYPGKDGIPLVINVELDGESVDAVQKALSQVFLTPRDSFVDLVPEYWRHCVLLAVTMGGKNTDACRFSQDFLQLPGLAYQPPAGSRAQGTDMQKTAPTGLPSHGPGISSPRVISQTDPQFSMEARRARFGGSVVLRLLINESGIPGEIQILQPLGGGLDAQAVRSVQGWKFEPGTKDGQPAPMRIAVEVDFHLWNPK